MALLKLAIRNLKRNRRRTMITLVALVVGVAAMVCIKGFILGMRRQILENQMKGTLGALQIHRKGYVKNVLSAPLTLDFADTPELRAKVAKVPGVTALAPRIEFGAQISTPDLAPMPDDGSDLPEALKGKASFLIVTAFDPSLEKQVTPKRWEWAESGRGQLPTKDDAEVVVLNDDFAKSLGIEPVKPGAPLPPVEQRLALIAPDRDSSLNGENVMLAGTLASATPNDRRVGLLPITVAQRLLRMEGRVTEYGLAVDPDADLPTVKNAVATVVGPEFEVQTWEERIPFVKDIVETQDFVFGIVSSIFLLVVLLGIVNAMLMSVLERVREIGTMLAVGMHRIQIIQLFLAEGLMLGLIGGTVGLVVGALAVAWANHHGLPIPAPGAKVASVVRPTVDAVFLLGVLVEASLGAALAALWPAFHASRLRPVEALSKT